MAVISALFILAHLYAITIELAIIGLVIGFLMLALYFRFGTKDALALILTPIAFGLNIPCTVPIVFGLTGNPMSGVAIGCGTIVYYFLEFVKLKAVLINGTTILDRIKYISDNILKNQTMILTAVAFIIVVLVVHLIKKLSVDHSWSIAIATGGIVNIFVMLVGDFVLDVSYNLPVLFLGTIAAVFISSVVQFFVFSVDYTRTKNVQFEDDVYYYYVKAVPKLTIASPSFKVQRINPQKRKKNEEEVDDFDELIISSGYEEDYNSDYNENAYSNENANNEGYSGNDTR